MKFAKPIILLIVLIVVVIGVFFVWQKGRISELDVRSLVDQMPSDPVGITISSVCKIVGMEGSIDPSISGGYVLQSNEWLIDCGSFNSDARSIFGSILESSGWQFCDLGLGRGAWWKEGIITSVSESAGLSYPFRISQNEGVNCSSPQLK